MAYEFYISIEGATQGPFKGESTRTPHAEKIAGLSYNHQISAPRDVASGRASGKRQHGAIAFTKEWGASSPQLFQALCNNEILNTVAMEFYKTNKEGQEIVYHKITLTGASVAKIEYSTGSAESASTAKTQASYDTHELETVSLTYTRIDVENVEFKTMASDDWEAPNV